jgi:folate-binding protein YgfZ
LKERIESYLIADEVTVVDETNRWARFALWGEGASAALATIVGVVPATGQFAGTKDGIAFRGRMARESFELLVPAETSAAVAQRLGSLGAQPAESEAAERERILAGIPAIPADIGANDLPNEGGLDEVAISYTKGCYLGQEVMARLKNLGQVRRYLHVVRGAGTMPAPATLLYQGAKKVGDVRSVARDGDGFVAMAMLSLVNFDAAQPLSGSSEGPATIKVVRHV